MDYDDYSEARFRWRAYLVGWILATAATCYFGLDSDFRLTLLLLAGGFGATIPANIESPFINDALRARHPDEYRTFGLDSASRWFWLPALPLSVVLGAKSGDPALEVMKRSVRVGWAFPFGLFLIGLAFWDFML